MPMMRLCLTCGVPFPLERGKSRCPSCAQAYERERGKRKSALYNGEHQRKRKQGQALVKAGLGGTCVRCGLPLLPSDRTDLDHLPGLGTGSRMVHERCNRSHLNSHTYGA